MFTRHIATSTRYQHQSLRASVFCPNKDAAPLSTARMNDRISDTHTMAARTRRALASCK